MKEVSAYEDSKGGLHKSETSCAAAELQILSAGSGTVDRPIEPGQAAKLVHNRKAVIAALQAVDAPRAGGDA